MAADPTRTKRRWWTSLRFWLTLGVGVVFAVGLVAKALETPMCTSGPAHDQPAWSPDGTEIAYTYVDTATFSGLGRLFDVPSFPLTGSIVVISVDGSDAVRLTDTEASDPAWSPDGKRIAFARDGGIFVIDADGSNETPLWSEAEIAVGPAWSPDGTRIAFAAGSATGGGSIWRSYEGALYVMNADGSDAIEILKEGSPAEPAWSPDGSELAYTLEDWGGLYVANADGSNVRELEDFGGGSPNWSPDGTTISYATTGGLVVIRSDGSKARLEGYPVNPTVVVEVTLVSERPILEASWSPDGTRIAFTKGRRCRTGESIGFGGDIHASDQRHIFIMNSDGTNPTQLTND